MKHESTNEPVAVVDANDDGYFAEILPDRSVKVGQFLFAHLPVPSAQPKDDCQYAKDIGMTEHRCVDKCYYEKYPQPQLQRKPLTDEQIAEMWKQYNPLHGIASFARAIEAAHGIKE